MFDDSLDRQLTACQAGFANAPDPLVGVDHHEEVVPRSSPDWVALDIGDLHCVSLASLRFAINRTFAIRAVRG